MAFNYLSYLDKFLSDYKAGIFTNNSVAGVRRVAQIGPHYQLIGIHHLTGNENRSGHQLYMSVVDVAGKRLVERIEWGWTGQRPAEKSPPIVLDKPPSEPQGDLPIFAGQVIWGNILGKASDVITDVTTILPDEIEPGGEKWNTIGHHSHYCAWIWNDGEIPPPPPPPDCDEVRQQLATVTLRYNALLAGVRALGK